MGSLIPSLLPHGRGSDLEFFKTHKSVYKNTETLVELLHRSDWVTDVLHLLSVYLIITTWSTRTGSTQRGVDVFCALASSGGC